MKKFGLTSKKEEQELIEKRKLKFSNPAVGLEDPDLLKKRQ